MKCFLVLMHVFTVLCLCFSDCHDSTCAFLIVMLILIYVLFYRTCDYFSVCVKCFNTDVCMHLRYFAHAGFFVILILLYAFIEPVLSCSCGCWLSSGF